MKDTNDAIEGSAGTVCSPLMIPNEIAVNICQSHIGNGVPKSESCCPVGLAVAGLLPGYEIEVDPHSAAIHVTHDGVGGSYSMPGHVVTKFIDRFDSGETVGPTSFVAHRE